MQKTKKNKENWDYLIACFSYTTAYFEELFCSSPPIWLELDLADCQGITSLF